MIGILLGGIVAMQVSLLRLNTGISRAVADADARSSSRTSALQASIAELTSGDRVTRTRRPTDR